MSPGNPSARGSKGPPDGGGVVTGRNDAGNRRKRVIASLFDLFDIALELLELGLPLDWIVGIRGRERRAMKLVCTYLLLLIFFFSPVVRRGVLRARGYRPRGRENKCAHVRFAGKASHGHLSKGRTSSFLRLTQ
jgi:hypothetical protein